MRFLKKGDKVEFIGGVIPEQVKFASADYPSDLIIGRIYEVESTDIQKWYTKIKLKNKSGEFNSVHFHVV